MKNEYKAPNLFLQFIPTWLVGLILMGCGALILMEPSRFLWLDAEQRHSVSDALLVAGLLAFAVDPFIKARLYREVAAGTFQYLLGFSQPREIQEALRKLAFETKVYARDLRVLCRIERADEHNVRIRIESTVRIENPTFQIAEHEPRLDFEEMERPTVDNITINAADEARVFHGNLKSSENSVLTQRTDSIILGPNESVMVMYAYSVVLPDHFFYTHYFGTRTIGVTLTVTAPRFEVSSDLGGKAPAWERQGLSMIGDHYSIRWKPI